MPIVNRIADLHDEIKTWRRDFHAHPELLYDVHRPAEAVAEKLKGFGCDEVVMGLGRTGVVGVIRGAKPAGAGAGATKVIGLRADMDALPIEEATGLPYQSTAPGKASSSTCTTTRRPAPASAARRRWWWRSSACSATGATCRWRPTTSPISRTRSNASISD